MDEKIYKYVTYFIDDNIFRFIAGYSNALLDLFFSFSLKEISM